MFTSVVHFSIDEDVGQSINVHAYIVNNRSTLSLSSHLEINNMFHPLPLSILRLHSSSHLSSSTCIHKRLDLPRLASVAPTDSSLHPNSRVLLLGQILPLVRQQHGTVDSDGQASVSAAQHDCAQDQFAEFVPRAAEAVRVVRDADAYSDCL